MALNGGGTSTRLATLCSPRALVAGRREARRACSRTRADKTDRANHGRSRCTARGRSTETERVHWRVSVLCLFARACACMCACDMLHTSDHFEEVLANSRRVRARVGVFLRACVRACVCMFGCVRPRVRARVHARCAETLNIEPVVPAVIPASFA